jgi:hypothetical protein
VVLPVPPFWFAIEKICADILIPNLKAVILITSVKTIFHKLTGLGFASNALTEKLLNFISQT